MATGLSLLAENYSSSDDEDETVENDFPDQNKKEIDIDKCNKRRTEEIEREAEVSYKKAKTSQTAERKEKSSLLPVPSSIKGMFDARIDSWEDDPALHDGRIRTFKHEVGSWATFVHVPITANSSFDGLIHSLLKILISHNLKFQPVDNLHLSVSRTVTLRHHWINPLLGQMKKKFTGFPRFPSVLKSVDVYTNEEKSRTFVGLKVHDGFTNLKSVVESVDECFADFALDPFYKPPSFHVSVAWCIGNEEDRCLQLMPLLQETLEECLQSTTTSRRIFVDKLQLRSGNKMFTVPF